ncbi:hypothetical protein [Phenylobacterium sp.]|uniref:hypothetical protein n=1 Tax=Phenylobacterium sp. TaxID=1871053 RepID=UPI00286AB88A|nr:hypothetical protein [Phenylobacterium sp.]
MAIFNQETPKAKTPEATDGKTSAAEHNSFAPHARKVEPLVEGEKHDQLAHKEGQAEDRQEALLDEALEESFPSSDPVSVKRIT